MGCNKTLTQQNHHHILIFSYEVAGQRNEAVCAQGSWIAATSLRCVPVDCRRLKVPLATVACSDGTTYGSECIFKCDKPARLVGRLPQLCRMFLMEMPTKILFYLRRSGLKRLTNEAPEVNWLVTLFPKKSKICFLMIPVPQYCFCSPVPLK